MHDELTRVDIQKMQQEIEYREQELMPKIIKDVQTARAFGDLSENFEYKAAKREKNRNGSRIRYLERMIRTAKLVSAGTEGEEAGLFDRVRLRFEEDGEDAFREAETRALKRLELRKSLLVSCGGGIVERPENCALMHEMGVVVFLDGDLEDSLRQIQCPERRPDLGDRDNAERVYAYRRPLYEQTADITIDIRNKSFTEVAAASGQLLWERGLL